MLVKTTFALLLIMGLSVVTSSVAHAQRPPSVFLEGAIETSADQVTLPSSLEGKLNVRDAGPLPLDARTRFLVSGREVGLKEMAAQLRAAGSQPVTVLVWLKDGIVSRVMLGGGQ